MSTQIKILHIVFSLDPGGMENGLVNVASRLPAEEFQVDVCCLERRGDFADRLPDSSRVIVLGKQPGKSITTIGKVLQVVRRLKPDIVHTHDLGPLIYGVWGTLGGRLARLVHGEHCQFSDEELTVERMKQRRRYYQYCHKIHTVSTSLSEHISHLNLTDKQPLSLINGVDTERFSPTDKAAAKAVFNIPADSRVIGVVGRLAPHKRHSAIIDAFDGLESADNVYLLLVGDGQCMQQLQARRDASPHKNQIIIPGFIPDPEKAYRAMDVLLLPSLLEGLSNALLEAMACGVPCVAHCACGCAEAIDNGVTGYIFDLKTDDTLMEAITQIMTKASTLSELGTNARHAILERFSIATMVTCYVDMYRQVVEAKR